MFREMRRMKQEVTKGECVKVLTEGRRGALAVSGDDGYPYVLPLNFFFDEKTDKIYFHCAKEGHKLDAIRRNEKVCFTVWTSGTKKGGDWAYYVTSVIAFGKARIVKDPSVVYEKVKAIGNKYYPSAEDVDAELERSINRVQLVEISIDHMSGKLVHER